MPTASELIIRVRTDGTGQARAELVNLDRQIDQTGQTAGKSAGKFGSLKQGIEQLSPVALGATGAVVGLGLATKGSIDASMAWESSLAGVAKTLDDTGLSATEFDAAVQDIGAQIRQMSTEIPIAAGELAGVAEAAGQLGIARDDVVSFTETMALLGVATDLTAEQSAVAIARIANITGLATDDIDNFGAALVDLGNNSAATESEILDMATRIAAAGSMAGLTEGEILGLAAALTSVGINAEAGGTAITQVMSEITKSVETTDDRLATFAEVAGMSAEQFAAAWRTTPGDALVSFVEGLNRLESAGESSVLVLDELGLAGIRQSQALRSTAGAGDLMRNSMERGNEAMEENVALQEEAARRFETSASQLQILKNEMTNTAIAAGDQMVPAVITLGNAMLVLRDNIIETKNALMELSGVSLGSESDIMILEAAMRVGSGSSQDLRKDLDTLWNGFVLGKEVMSDATRQQREWTDATDDEKRAVEGLIDRVLELAGTIPDATASAIAYQERIALIRDNQYDWNEHTGESVSVMVEFADSMRRATEDGHRHNQMLQDGTGAYDAATVAAGLLMGAQDDLAAANDFSRQAIDATRGAINLWESDIRANEDAIKALDEQLADGNITVDEHAEKVGILTWQNERLAGGIDNDLIPAWIDARVRGAELQQELDDLDTLFKDGKISQQEYATKSAEIRDEQEKLANPMQTIIEKLETIIDRLIEADGIDPHIEMTADTDAVIEAIESMRRYAANNPINVPMYGTVAGGNDAVMYVPGGSAGGNDRESQSNLSLRSNKAAWYADGVEKGKAFGTGVGEGIMSASPVISDAGKEAGREYGEEFEGEFLLTWNEMWVKASQDAARIFENDIVGLMDGSAADAALAAAGAAEAFMESWIEAGFSPDAPAYKEAQERFEEAMAEYAIITGIAGTEAAQEFWEQWERENAERQYPEQAAREAAENIWRSPDWGRAGGFSAFQFFDTFEDVTRRDILDLPKSILFEPDFLDQFADGGATAGEVFATAFQKNADNMLVESGGDGTGGGGTSPGGGGGTSPGSGGGGGGGSVPLDSGDLLFAPELDAAVNVSGLSDGFGRVLTLGAVQGGRDVSDWLTMILKEFGTDHTSVVLRYPGALDPDDLAEVQAIMAWLESPFKSPDTFPQFATGGFITGEGLALLHPNEYITPDRSIPQLARELAQEFGKQGGRTVHLTVNTQASDPQAVAQVVINELDRMYGSA